MKEIDGKEVLANGCVGEAFRKRECNTQPCPSDKELQQKVKEDNNKLNEARVYTYIINIRNLLNLCRLLISLRDMTDV